MTKHMVMYGKYAWANVSKIYIMRKKNAFSCRNIRAAPIAAPLDPLVKQTNKHLAKHK